MTDAKKLSAWELARQLNEVSRQLAELEAPAHVNAAAELVRMDAAELVADGARRLVGVLDCIAAAGTTAELEQLVSSRSGTWARQFTNERVHGPGSRGDTAADTAERREREASAGFDRALGEGRR